MIATEQFNELHQAALLYPFQLVLADMVIAVCQLPLTRVEGPFRFGCSCFETRRPPSDEPLPLSLDLVAIEMIPVLPRERFPIPNQVRNKASRR